MTVFYQHENKNSRIKYFRIFSVAVKLRIITRIARNFGSNFAKTSEMYRLYYLSHGFKYLKRMKLNLFE